MIIEMKIPRIDDETDEFQVIEWLKEDGSVVKKNEDLVQIDSLFDTYLVPADADGILQIVAEEGAAVKPDDILCNIIVNPDQY